MLLRDCKKRGRVVSVVKGGNDRKRSNKRKRDGDEEASHNTMGGNFVLYSTLPSKHYKTMPPYTRSVHTTSYGRVYGRV